MTTTQAAGETAPPKKLWRVTTSSSGPLGVGEGVVYAPLAEGGNHYAALDAATGEVLWKTPLHGKLPPRFDAAVTAGEVVVQRYTPTRPKVLVTMNRATGAALRDVRCAGESDALDESSALVFGPFRFGSHVVCVTYGPLAPALREANRLDQPLPRGHVTATDPSTGTVVYDVELPEGVVPHTVTADGERILLGGRRTGSGTSDEHLAWQGQVLALRGVDGKVLWRSEPGPALNGGGHGVALADLREGRARIQHVAASDVAPNELVAFDAATGAIRFRRPMPGGWTSFVAGDRIVCVEPLTDAAVALDAKTGAELWRAPSPHGEEAPKREATIHGRSFAACAGRLWFTGSKGGVLGLDLATGAQQRINQRGFTLASDGTRLFVGDAGSLTAYGFSAAD